jgi:dynein heavy chain
MYWQKGLASINEVVVTCGEVQRTWSFLESLFIHSEEVKKELPAESQKFIGIDENVKKLLIDAFATKKALDFCIKDKVLETLEDLQKELTVCEKALNEFMDSKRLAFPRFFFVSPADLLDILSNGNQPSKIMCHMPKIISAMETLVLREEGIRPFAEAMVACVGTETVQFGDFTKKLLGKVEIYLEEVLCMMRDSLKDLSLKSLKKFGEIDKETWLQQDPAMVTLLINNCSWVIGVENSFSKVAGGDKNAVEKALANQIDDLKALIMMVQGDLTKPVR